jgi:thiamine biosynthesis protein ThiS
MMVIVVNGERREVRDGLSVRALLDEERTPASHVLVEVNGVYQPLRRGEDREIADGDRVEIILPAVGG